MFGIGLSRTGTLSLNVALTILGIKAEHFPHDTVTARELRRGTYDLSILRDTQALTDITVAPYYAQLDETFPGSKFILTTRPVESWLCSVENHFGMDVVRDRDDFVDFIHAVVYGTLHFNEARFAFVKELHEANVRQYFRNRPQQLLILDLFRGDGWDDLCAYLDVPKPEVRFPHENQAATAPVRWPRSLDERKLNRAGGVWRMARRRYVTVFGWCSDVVPRFQAAPMPKLKGGPSPPAPGATHPRGKADLRSTPARPHVAAQGRTSSSHPTSGSSASADARIGDRTLDSSKTDPKPC